MKKSSIHIIIIPGNGGATMENHWFPAVIAGFEEHGIKVRARTYPDSYLARRKYWIPFLETELKAGPDSILIGHSSGAEAAMRYAEDHQILGSVLISPCHTDMGVHTETISGWYTGEWEWEKIRKNQRFILQFSSRDDPIVPIGEQDFVRSKLAPEYHELENRGHFISQNEFPELVTAVMEKVESMTVSG